MRIERASAALDAVDETTYSRELVAYIGQNGLELARLREDMRAWIGVAQKLLSSLGADPTSRAALGLDVVRAAALANQWPVSNDDPLDLSRLSPQEVIALEALVEKATKDGGDA